MKRTIAAFTIFCLAVAVAQEYTPDPSWTPPDKEATRKNPLKKSDAVVAGGKKLFLRNCKPCHGEAGDAGLHHSANLQLPIVQQQSDGTLFWKVTNGNVSRGMPSFSGLPDLQRWQLVMYIRTLAH